MAEVIIVGGFDLAREALAGVGARALRAVGAAWAGHAKGAEATFQKWGDALRESVRYEVDGDAVAVGSDMDIAAYAELGTGRHYAPPPEWMENRVRRGSKGDAAWWIYRGADGAFGVGTPQAATPFLRPALEAHRDEYREIVERCFRDDG